MSASTMMAKTHRYGLQVLNRGFRGGAADKRAFPGSQMPCLQGLPAIAYVRRFCFISNYFHFCIHDTDEHNPHAHIMLTVRPLDKNGKWQSKTEKEYLCVKNGEERGFTSAELICDVETAK